MPLGFFSFAYWQFEIFCFEILPKNQWIRLLSDSHFVYRSSSIAKCAIPRNALIISLLIMIFILDDWCCLHILNHSYSVRFGTKSTSKGRNHMKHINKKHQQYQILTELNSFFSFCTRHILARVLRFFCALLIFVEMIDWEIGKTLGFLYFSNKNSFEVNFGELFWTFIGNNITRFLFTNNFEFKPKFSIIFHLQMK